MKNQEVTLPVLWEVFWKKKVPLLLTVVLVFAGLLALSLGTYQPQYTSVATLYVLHRESTGENADVYNQFSLALKAVDDCSYLLQSPRVLERTAEELQLDWSEKELSGRIAIHNPANTRILEVAVTGDSPEQAKQIADTLCRIGQEEIFRAMEYRQVNLFEEGRVPTQPSNDRRIPLCALGAVAAGTVLYTVFLVFYLRKEQIPEMEILP